MSLCCAQSTVCKFFRKATVRIMTDNVLGQVEWICRFIKIHFSFPLSYDNLSRVMSKPDFAYAKTKTQISFVVTAKLISAFVFATRIVQSLYFLYTKPSSVALQPGLCRTWSETPKTGFLTTRLILSCLLFVLF